MTLQWCIKHSISDLSLVIINKNYFCKTAFCSHFPSFYIIYLSFFIFINYLLCFHTYIFSHLPSKWIYHFTVLRDLTNVLLLESMRVPESTSYEKHVPWILNANLPSLLPYKDPFRSFSKRKSFFFFKTINILKTIFSSLITFNF